MLNIIILLLFIAAGWLAWPAVQPYLLSEAAEKQDAAQSEQETPSLRSSPAPATSTAETKTADPVPATGAQSDPESQAATAEVTKPKVTSTEAQSTGTAAGSDATVNASQNTEAEPAPKPAQTVVEATAAQTNQDKAAVKRQATQEATEQADQMAQKAPQTVTNDATASQLAQKPAEGEATKIAETNTVPTTQQETEAAQTQAESQTVVATETKKDVTVTDVPPAPSQGAVPSATSPAESQARTPAVPDKTLKEAKVANEQVEKRASSDPAPATVAPAKATQTTEPTKTTETTETPRALAAEAPLKKSTTETVTAEIKKVQSEKQKVLAQNLAKATEETAPQNTIPQEATPKDDQNPAATAPVQKPSLSFKTETSRQRQKQAAALLADKTPTVATPADKAVDEAKAQEQEVAKAAEEESAPVLRRPGGNAAQADDNQDSAREVTVTLTTPQPAAEPVQKPEPVKSEPVMADAAPPEPEPVKTAMVAVPKAAPKGEPESEKSENADRQDSPEMDAAAPRFDVVRVSRDGMTVMAGRAPEHATVEIIERDTVLAEVEADRRGEWAVILDQPMGAGQRQLSLRAYLSNGRVVDANSTIVIIVPPRGDRIQTGTALTMAVDRLKAKPTPKSAAIEPDAETTSPQAEQAEEKTISDSDTSVVPAPATGAVVVELPKQAPGARLLQKPQSQTKQARLAPQQSDGESAKVYIDAINYDAEGNVDISGRAGPRATLRAYLNNRLVGDILTNAEGGWRLTLGTPIPPGEYVLRVDQLDSIGKVVSRSEIPFAREEPAAAIAAFERQQDQQTGASQAANVIVQPGNSLWRIARRVYGRGILYSVIYDANQAQIRDPDLIYPGQIFDLPERERDTRP